LNLLGSNDTNWVWKLQDGGETKADKGRDDKLVVELLDDVDVADYDDTDDDGIVDDEEYADDDEDVEQVPELSPHRLQAPAPGAGNSSLDSDIVLLSDDWFSNASSIPTNAPKTVEFYLDNSDDSETIDLTMGGDNDDKKVRQPKQLKDEDLVVYYPISGEPFLSFSPDIEFASIVRSAKK
jgi:hypothetical protein